MPRVTLTAAQREAAKRADQARDMADRLAVYKNRRALTNKDIASELGIRLETVGRLLAADSTVRMPLATVWRLEEMIRS